MTKLKGMNVKVDELRMATDFLHTIPENLEDIVPALMVQQNLTLQSIKQALLYHEAKQKSKEKNHLLLSKEKKSYECSHHGTNTSHNTANCRY